MVQLISSGVLNAVAVAAAAASIACLPARQPYTCFGFLCTYECVRSRLNAFVLLRHLVGFALLLFALAAVAAAVAVAFFYFGCDRRE